MPRSRKTKPTPATRFCAAMSLVVWLAALTFCSADCFTGDSHCQAGHEEQAASAHHDSDQAPDSEKHDGHNDSFCDSLKAMVHSSGGSVLPKLDFRLASTLSSVPHSQALAVAQSEAPASRQPPDRDWVFTPAVYLGPAFRSHAPPVLL